MASSRRKAKRPGRKITAFQALALLLSFVLLSGAGGLLTAALAVPAASVIKDVTNTGVEMFDALPTNLDIGPLSEQSRVRLADGTILATFYVQNRIVVSIDQISQAMQDAVVATEDKRFYEHGAIDPIGMLRALFKNTLSGSTQEGASTLTQQYVKNLLIEQANRTKDDEALKAAIAPTPERKIREARLAVWVEQQLTKKQILEGYLNIAPFGKRVYGVEAAANYYFGISASELNYLQAATIAGITQAPSRWDPTSNPQGAQNRRDTVLYLMHKEGYITDEEYETGTNTPLADTLNITPSPVGCEIAGNAAFFCDYVIRTILNSPEFGETAAEREALLYRGGLDIYITMDTRLQNIAAQVAADTVPATDESGVAAAIVIVEPGTGRILAMAQSRPFSYSSTPEPGYTSINYSVDYDYGGSNGFQPGSSFKPIVLAEWLAAGKNLMQRVDATRRTYDGKVWTASCLGPGLHSFGNYRPGNVDATASGPITVLNATERSINTAYIDMTFQLDTCNIQRTAELLGFHRSDNKEYQPYASSTLGTQEASPLTMANVYATFAANGVRCDPVAISKVTDTNGHELPVPQANCQQVLVPQITSAVTYALEKTINYGQKPASLGSFPAAGKTGTAQDNTQTWFVGYTAQLSTAVWIGNPSGYVPIQNVYINGKYYRSLFGSDLAAPTWKNVMQQAVEGMEPIPFPEPDEKQIFGERVRVPGTSGLSVEEATSMLQSMGFRVNIGTPEYHESIPVGAVVRTTPGGGSMVPPGSMITIIPSNGVDPETIPPPEPTPTPPAQPGPGNPGPGNPGPGNPGQGGGNNDDD